MTECLDQQAVYVLNRRAYQETSLIVDVFSLHHGRFSLVAKGAMRKNKSWSALLQPFQSLIISWSGRSSLKTLRSIDVPSEPFKLNSSYLFSAYYLNELLIKLLPEFAVNEEVFGFYLSALCRLNEGENLQLVLREFEYKLLFELGQLPDFFLDTNLQPIETGFRYRLRQQNGFEKLAPAAYKANGDVSGRVICLLRGDDCYQASAWVLDDYRQAKGLMRLLVDEALGGQEIKSRELFRQVKFKG